jgi:hypothetical protein
MQGTIAQIVALAMHGNAILQDASGSQSLGFQASNSTFAFCESVRFVAPVRSFLSRKEVVYATDPHSWFQRLRKESVYALRLSYGPSGANKLRDRMLVGFVGGGGKWIIETRGPKHSDYWESRWQIGNRDRADKKIWRVAYVRVGNGKPSPWEESDNLKTLKDEMRQTLQEIAQFSRSQNLDSFSKAFESGLYRLESPTPFQNLYHADIAPLESLPLSASQLLGSAEAAWVFGGMGSWNDQGFDGQAQTRYQELSEKLYQLLNRVIVAATNSGIRPNPGVSS